MARLRRRAALARRHRGARCRCHPRRCRRRRRTSLGSGVRARFAPGGTRSRDPRAETIGGPRDAAGRGHGRRHRAARPRHRHLSAHPQARPRALDRRPPRSRPPDHGAGARSGYGVRRRRQDGGTVRLESRGRPARACESVAAGSTHAGGSPSGPRSCGTQRHRSRRRSPRAPRAAGIAASCRRRSTHGARPRAHGTASGRGHGT